MNVKLEEFKKLVKDNREAEEKLMLEINEEEVILTEYKHNSVNTLFNSDIDELKSLKIHRNESSHVTRDHNQLKTMKLLLDYKDTYCPDFEYKVSENEGWYIFKDIDNSYYKGKFSTIDILGLVYFTKEVAQQLLEDIKAGVVKL